MQRSRRDIKRCAPLALGVPTKEKLEAKALKVPSVELAGGKFEGGFRGNVGSCVGNDGREGSIAERGRGSLTKCSMESKDGLGGGGLVVLGGRSSRLCLVRFSEKLWGKVVVKHLGLMEEPFDNRWVVMGYDKKGKLVKGTNPSGTLKILSHSSTSSANKGGDLEGGLLSYFALRDSSILMVSLFRMIKGKGLLGPNGESGGKFEGGFRGNVGSCAGNDGREGSISERGRGLLTKCLMESKDGLGGGGLVVLGGRYSRCLDGWAGAGGGEVKGGSVDFGVSRTLLDEILREIMRESCGEAFGVDGGAV
nr:hypothetical protein [Tanacetum cinerariifolium]